MMEENQQVEEISKFISKEFILGGADSLIPVGEFQKMDEFKPYLTEKLRDLLDNHYGKLLNILYKIDVGEEKLSELFSGKNRESIPESLADLIIERSLQNVWFRQKYREGKL